MGMMREKTEKKGGSDKEEQEGNEVDTNHEDDEYETLIDYTLKVLLTLKMIVCQIIDRVEKERAFESLDVAKCK